MGRQLRADTVVIPGRFHGPPESGNGGYSAGVAAGTIEAATVAVRLHTPPPLDRPLAVRRDGEDGTLLDGTAVVAQARPATLDIAIPEPVDVATAVAARNAFDAAAYAARHAFPTCFTCGPGREPGDGLRLFPAPAGDRDGFVVSPWTPNETHALDDGLIAPQVMWAALDCPGGLSWIDSDPDTGAAVLGELTATVTARPTPGDHLVVAGWRIRAEGRKRIAGSVVWDERGDVLAVGEAVWIVLDGEQLTSFNAVAP